MIAVLAAALPLSIAHADFEKASAHIDVDGSMLAYLDFTGDGGEIATALNGIYRKIEDANPQIPPVIIDFELLFDNLGFGSLQSVAMSSKDIKPGLHRNRSVTLYNGEPAGIFALYQTDPLTFSAADWAPADATGAMSASVSLIGLRDTLSKVFQQIMGPMGEGLMKQQLGQTVPGTGLSYNELVEALSGRWDGFWRQSYNEEFEQDFKLWMQIEDAGHLLKRARNDLEQMGIVYIENEATLKANLTPWLGGAAPVELLVEASKESGALSIYTDSTWSPQSEGLRLSDTADFKALADRLPQEGMAFTYSKGADLDPIVGEVTQIPQVAPYADAIRAALELLVGDYLEPSMTMTAMEGNAMYTDQYAGYSTKQLMTSVPLVVGGGLGAAMAVPAFQKVRSTSQEKAVTNNLRQIASAANQYFLEYDVTEVTIDELVGEYLRDLKPIAGESYEGMLIRKGEAIRVTLEDGTVVSVNF